MKRPSPEIAKRLRGVADEVLVGNGSTSVDDVASASGVPRATLYYYFTGRDELVDFLLLDKVEQIGAGMTREATQSLDEESRLETLLTGMVHTIARNPVLCTTLLSRLAVLSEADELVATVDRKVMRPLGQLLEDGRRAGRFEVSDIDLTAHALYGALSMGALSRFARDGGIDAAATAAALVPQLIAAVRRATPDASGPAAATG